MLRSASHPLVHQRAVISIRLDVDQWCIEYPMLISDGRLVEVGVRGEEVGLMRPLEKLIPDAISDQAKGLVILTAVNLGPVERMVPGFHHLPSLFIWFWMGDPGQFISFPMCICGLFNITKLLLLQCSCQGIRHPRPPAAVLYICSC
ncbi:unnamed protein product [Musa banksii]